MTKPTVNEFKNPWDQRGSGPDSLEDTIKAARDKILRIFRSNGNYEQNGNNNHGFPSNYLKKLMIGGALIVSLLWLSTGFYTVATHEEGVIMRFGRFSRVATPGLNYKIPDPIERVIKVSVTRVNKEEVGFRSSGEGFKRYESTGSGQRAVQQESQMLTGDENIIDIDFDVQWRINNAQKFLFNVRDLGGENTVKAAAESAIREVIGHSKISDALAEERYQIEQKTKSLLQSMVDSYEMGVEIVRLQLLRVEPPREVLDSYRDIQSAKADSESERNRAYAYRNNIIPKARGEAEKILQEAEGYKSMILADARGEAARFKSVYEQYKNAKAPIRKRIYLESMEKVLQDMPKVIVSKNGTMQFLNMQDLFANKGKEGPSNAAPGANTGVSNAQQNQQQAEDASQGNK